MKPTNILRTILSLFFLSLVNPSYSQPLATSYYYDGYWSRWKEADIDWTQRAVCITVSGTFSEFCMYYREDHPSNYFFKFHILNYSQPTKKEIKQHYKSNTTWIYRGNVEYYVCDVYPTFEDCLKELKRPLRKSDLNSNDYQSRLSIVRANQIKKTGNFIPIGYKKVVKSSEIRIMAYKKNPNCYNFIFDNVGYAVDFRGNDAYSEILKK